jgi:SH3 domain protein
LVTAPLVTALWAGEAAAEAAWVRGGIRLNLRTEPGTRFRIIDGVSTGDAVTVLSRTEGWTRVRLADGKQGWIPEGYLQSEPPPTVRLEQLTDEVTSLRAQLESSNARTAELETSNETLTGRDGGQRSEIDRLKVENTELRASKRWPEWITGASVLAVGMLLGAILHRNATRRPSSRIRL